MNLQNEVQQKLTYAQYQELDKYLSISSHRLTKIFNDPTIINVEELKKLSEIMNVSFETLITDYQAGVKTITVGEYFQLKEAAIKKR